MTYISSFKINRAAQAIISGGVVAYPTEAVFGLGCDPLNSEAVFELLSLKKRAVDKGLILIASSIEQLKPYILMEDYMHQSLAESWPGPVTWVIPCQHWVPDWLTGGRNSLAVRVTAHPVAKALCEKVNSPLVSTSANTTSYPPARQHWQVIKKLQSNAAHILSGNVGTLSQATPIYNISDQKQIR